MMNLVLVVPWSMAATYTSSPSPAMIPPAQRSSTRETGGSSEWEETGSNKLGAVGRGTPGEGGGEFIGDHGRIR
jgi:hypothetical protein